MSTYFSPYWPGSAGLATLGAAIVVWFGFGLIGNALTRARRLRAEDMLAGFGAAFAAVVVLHWIGHPPLALLSAMLGLVALACGVFRARAVAASELWRPLLLLLPALVVASGVPLDEWDSFSHWGLNAAWVWRHGVLPWPGVSAPPSSNPDYPYGYPFLIYLTGLARGGYAENAGAVLNAVLLVPAAQILSRACAGFDAARRRAAPWRYSALGAVLALPLMPWFQRSTTLADYADTLLAVGLLAFAVSAWRWMERRGDWHKSEGGGIGLAALALALVVGKESGLLVLPVLLVALAVVQFRQGGLPAWRDAGVFTVWLLPALAVGAGWEWYVSGWLHSSFTVLAPAHWQWSLVPALLSGAADEVAGHGLFYLVLAAALALGVGGLWRGTVGTGWLYQFAALLVAGHLAVLFCAYLGGGFTDEEVRRAASFYRYGTQVGPLALACVACALSRAVAHRGAGARRAATRLAPAALAALIVLVAPRLYEPRTVHESLVLERGRALSNLLEPGSRVGLVGWQLDPYDFFLLRYQLFRPGRDDRDLSIDRVFARAPGTPRQLDRLLERLATGSDYRYLLVLHPPGLHRDADADMLLYRAAGDGWRRMDSWPGT